MTDTTKLFELAQLAEASYANLIPGKTLFSELQNPDFKMTFSATQAGEFVKHWLVAGHQADTVNGYSATLFQNKDTPNEYVYAIRGTAGSADLLADAGDIVVDGLALYQIVDMYNDWARIRAGVGNTYRAAKFVSLTAETVLLKAERLLMPLGVKGPYELSLLSRGDVVIDNPTGLVQTIDFDFSNVVFSDARAYGDVNLPPGATVTVAGHSLGGHLAAAFTRLFPSVGADAYTFNGAGFPTGWVPGLSGDAGTNIRNLFSMLDGAAAFDSGKILNLYGSAGWDFVTMTNPLGLVQQGSHQEIYTESFSWDPNVVGHGAGQVTDALAVYDLFIKLDNGLKTATPSAALGALRPIFEAGANDKLGTFESLVNALGKLFVAGFSEIAQSNWGKREELYSGIQHIRDSAAYQAAVQAADFVQMISLAGQPRDTLVTQAQTDIATRYALKELNPFALTGDASLYDRHNANGELDLYDPATGTGNLTESYLKDRAAFLYFNNQINTQDKADGIYLESLKEGAARYGCNGKWALSPFVQITG